MTGMAVGGNSKEFGGLGIEPRLRADYDSWGKAHQERGMAAVSKTAGRHSLMPRPDYADVWQKHRTQVPREGVEATRSRLMNNKSFAPLGVPSATTGRLWACIQP